MLPVGVATCNINGQILLATNPRDAYSQLLFIRFCGKRFVATFGCNFGAAAAIQLALANNQFWPSSNWLFGYN